MPQVKVILVENIYSYGNNKHNWREFKDSITDWEEISNEEVTLLRTNLQYLPPNDYYTKYQLIVKDDVPVLKRLAELMPAIEAKAQAEEAKRLKKSETAKKAAETRKRKEEAADKKLLKELQAKYGA
jgi:hypothetical protein